MTMAHALEARVPFMDHTLVEYTAAINPKSKLKLGKDKYVYREFIKSILPREIYKRKKQGFSIPLEEWMNTGLKEYALKLLEEIEIDFLNKDYIKKVINNATKNFYTKRQFWTILFFLEWYKQFKE